MGSFGWQLSGGLPAAKRHDLEEKSVCCAVDHKGHKSQSLQEKQVQRLAGQAGPSSGLGLRSTVRLL